MDIRAEEVNYEVNYTISFYKQPGWPTFKDREEYNVMKDSVTSVKTIGGWRLQRRGGEPVLDVSLRRVGEKWVASDHLLVSPTSVVCKLL